MPFALPAQLLREQADVNDEVAQSPSFLHRAQEVLAINERMYSRRHLSKIAKTLPGAMPATPTLAPKGSGWGAGQLIQQSVRF